MSNFMNLVPKTLALSGDNAIEAILTDIPLFCEGIMGIGVFTFLFIAKQVRWTFSSLYASSFMAFIAATLDLSQVIIRGSQDTAKGVGLDTIAGFLRAREVFLAFAVVLLDLYFWTLVAECPRGEMRDQSDQVSTSSDARSRTHSASWNRWGIVGSFLKWASLAVLLAVPLLQVLWRLLPTQRQYGSIYVAESILQTTVTAVFILKLILNVYISPLDSWWHAFRVYLGPMTALFLGISLGIGNLVLFAFTETALGRFLRAVEVYILIIQNLYFVLQNVADTARHSQEEAPPTWESEKSQTRAVLPITYSSRDIQVPRSTSPPFRRSPNGQILTLNVPQRNSNVILAIQSDPEETPNVIPFTPLEPPKRNGREKVTASPYKPSTSASSSIPVFNNVLSAPQVLVPSEKRLFPEMSLSYYGMDQDGNRETVGLFSESPTLRGSTVKNETEKVDPPTDNNAFNSRLSAGPSFIDMRVSRSGLPPSQQGSITSLDEILRQQNELDQSIAALRLFSTQSIYSNPPMLEDSRKSSDFSEFKEKLQASGRNTTGTKSPSNRSDFSLSIFPEPPIVDNAPISTKYSNEILKSRFEDGDSEAPTPTLRNAGAARGVPPINVPPPLESGIASAQTGITGNFNSAGTGGTQYDVTSFIGNLSSPSSTQGPGSSVIPSTGQIIMTADDLASDDAETPTIATAVLRPMLLASVASEPSERPALSASTYGPASEMPLSPPLAEMPVPLRPLYLGTANTPQLPAGMVPLAQRRTRGGTLTNVRRPVISTPRPVPESEVAPGAFERPRPPPLQLDQL